MLILASVFRSPQVQGGCFGYYFYITHKISRDIAELYYIVLVNMVIWKLSNVSSVLEHMLINMLFHPLVRWGT